VALLYFEKRLGEGVRLSPIQSSLLLGMGLQRKSVEEVEVRWSSSYLNSSSNPSIGRTPATCITSTRTFRETYPEDLGELTGDTKGRDKYHHPRAWAFVPGCSRRPNIPSRGR
jgi:hypothetical protein